MCCGDKTFGGLLIGHVAHAGIDEAAGVDHLQGVEQRTGVLRVLLERGGQASADECTDADAEMFDVGVGTQQRDGHRAAELSLPRDDERDLAEHLCDPLTRGRCGIRFGEEGTYPNEFFGVSIDGDSCCGGGFDVDLYSFFYAGGDAGEFGIFGWVGSYAAVTVDIGTNFYVGASAQISWEEVESLCFSFGFSW